MFAIRSTARGGRGRAPRRPALVHGLVLASFLLGSVALGIACRVTEDPRAGSSGSGTSSGSTPSTSGASGGGGGVDAASSELLACGPAPSASVPFTKAALLGASADCAAWHSCNFRNAATSLRTSIRAHVAAPSETTKTAARAAWGEAMSEWSAMELFQFGPVAVKTVDQYHGRSLRSFVHPWPVLNRCLVESQVVNKDYANGWNLVLAGGRGLFGLEYLLYFEGTDIACAPNAGATAKWNAATPEQLTADKLAYEAALAENLASLATEIGNVWAEGGEGFKAKLLAHDGYGTDQEALNVVAWSLLYAELEIKDLKLAPRAKIGTAAVNPETPFALVEIESIRTNLAAFRSLYQGCGAAGAGLGFDDWLLEAGATQLAQDISAALDGAIAAATAFPSFSTATEQQFAQLYATLKVLTDLVKTQFFGSASPLNLKLAPGVASDTD